MPFTENSSRSFVSSFKRCLSNVYDDEDKDATPIPATLSVSFTINGVVYNVVPDGKNITSSTTLNHYIRDYAQLKGTKHMCLEGGCGSCVVSVRFIHPVTKADVHIAVNSCLVTVLMCDKWNITTVEGLGNQKEGYNIIQSRLAEFNGTQCGFCSPGMVMNMYALQQTNSSLTSLQIENSFGGNMCRCTGYRPIADAFKSFAVDVQNHILEKIADIEDVKPCKNDPRKKCAEVCLGNGSCRTNQLRWADFGSEQWYQVFTLDQLFAVLNQIQDAEYMLVGGNTGNGVFRRSSTISVYIDITGVPDLREYTMSSTLALGASMTLAETMNLMNSIAEKNQSFKYLKQIASHWDLVANVPVRNAGTIGGNLFMKYKHNEFQSDIFITLEAFGAKLVIMNKNGGDPLELRPSEFLSIDMSGCVIVKINFYPLTGNYIYQSYKIMERAQNVRAIVNAAFVFEMDDTSTTVKSAQIVYGNINPSFIHAEKTEAFLVNQPLFDDNTLQQAYSILATELKVIASPPEPSPDARKKLAMQLFYKFILISAPESLVNQVYLSGGYLLERPVSKATHEFQTQQNEYPLTKPIPKLEALVQCSGEAKFVIDHDSTRTGFLFARFVLANTQPRSKIKSINTDQALKIPGVVGFLSAKDIPGENTFTPAMAGMQTNEEIFCSSEVLYNGQPLGLIVATNEDNATVAAKLVSVEYDLPGPNVDPPIVYTIRDALEIPDNPRIILEGSKDRDSKGNDIHKIISGSFDMGAQYHYTMETQSCVCIPIEDGMDVFPSSQWMELVQYAISNCTKIPENLINIEVRRLGGGYGSKITRATWIACACALAAQKYNKPVLLRMLMENNMHAIGKRYPCSADYQVGVNADGKIQFMDLNIYEDYGVGVNDPIAINTIYLVPNCYDAATWKINGYSVATDLPANTSTRAPGNCESIGMIESIMEHIAIELNVDSVQVKYQNLKTDPNYPIRDLSEYFRNKNDYNDRLKQVQDFNKNNRWKKRGLTTTLMEFQFNYFGNYHVLISIYAGDGTVAITHGGIEMGQGLNTKVAQVVAYSLGIDLAFVSVKPSNGLTAPNSFLTGGSVGSEACCLAAMKACEILNDRLNPFRNDPQNNTWALAVAAARRMNIDLMASAQFTPQDNVQGYSIYGVTLAEVEVDILTGQNQIVRVDLLEDTGESMSPEVDIGQVEGSFMMGLGYWLHEKIEYDKNGMLLTDRSWVYSPPGMKDIPIEWNIEFRKNSSNTSGVLRSKATGEPPLCMSIGVAMAIRQALASARLDSDSKADPWFPIYGPITADNVISNSLSSYQQFKLK